MPGVALARSPWKVCAQRLNRYAVAIEYDGSAYSGWQTQKSLRTIQGLVESALSGVAAERVEVVCAGRTDAGVHARSQIAHFDTNVTRPMRGWVMGANTELPRDISIVWARPVPLHFHARYSAEARTYRYIILNRSSRSALAAQRASSNPSITNEWWPQQRIYAAITTSALSVPPSANRIRRSDGSSA